MLLILHVAESIARNGTVLEPSGQAVSRDDCTLQRGLSLVHNDRAVGWSGLDDWKDFAGVGTHQRQGSNPNGSRRANVPPPGRPSRIPDVPEAHQYGIADLERETGFNARTIRYYIAKGLLPPAHGRGPSATYNLGHLLRLRLIQLLKAEFVPLEEIKDRLDLLSDREIAAMLDIRTRPPEDHWRRIELHPDIELHVRYSGGRDPNPALEEAVDLIVGLSRPVIDRLGDDR